MVHLPLANFATKDKRRDQMCFNILDGEAPEITKTLLEIRKLLLKVVSVTLLLVCFSSLKESTCETWKNVYFTFEALLFLEKIKF